ncbi:MULTISPECIES: LysR family transcriptional regulator [unclassified Rhizobium]|jgi:DNA-binding transcriptional LysR family regulator|uniref:LysR substrate-binding domain-containing protein n=1 Tax=unclassified Rhizobium TaxID=2613769 RepID=UPI0007C7C929|nr:MULTISPECIES: LysR family transcriptional regulator [unclassified Rhizobium]
MPDLALDLRHLRDAMLVIQYGSLRRAAEATDVSQSTLSRRVQSLERRLGIVLFERTKTGTRPTLAGERFLRNAEFGAEHLRRAVGDIALIKKGFVGGLRIGVMGSFAQGPLADLLATYRERFPKIEVRISEGTSHAHALAVLNGRIDAAFIVGEPHLPGCDTRHFYDEALFAAIPADHALASRTRLAWEDLRDETLLVMADGSGPEVEGIIARHISCLGFRPEIAVHQVGRDNLMNMVGKGYGLTLVVSSILGATYPGVRFIPIEPAEIVTWSVVWPRNNANPALKRLLELCDAVVRPAMTAPVGYRRSSSPPTLTP